MMYSSRIPLAFLWFCSLWTVIQANCSDIKMRHCHAPLDKFHRNLEKKYNTPLQHLNHHLNKENLREYCSVAAVANKCLVSLHGCGELRSDIFKGIEKGTNYTCHGSLREYEKHRQCYEKPVVEVGLHACGYQAVHQFRQLIHKAHHIHKHVCRIVGGNFKCAKDFTEGNCGREAVEWERRYLKHLYGPLISKYHCEKHEHIKDVPHHVTHQSDMPKVLNEDRPKFDLWAIILCAALAMITLVSFGIVAVRCWRNSKAGKQSKGGKQQEKKAHLAFHNVLSEPRKAYYI